MTKRLAMNVDGQMTFCSAPDDKIGMGRCNHVMHQNSNESASDFTERVNIINTIDEDSKKNLTLGSGYSAGEWSGTELEASETSKNSILNSETINNIVKLNGINFKDGKVTENDLKGMVGSNPSIVKELSKELGEPVIYFSSNEEGEGNITVGDSQWNSDGYSTGIFDSEEFENEISDEDEFDERNKKAYEWAKNKTGAKVKFEDIYEWD